MEKESRKKISVLGLGYIGLPTACMLANNGFNVLGIDINNKIIQKLKSGILHISEKDLESIFIKALENKRLRISSEVEDSDIFIISVPTPLGKDNRADLSYVKSAVDNLKGHIKKGNIVILESTSPPGTTIDLLGSIINKHTGLSAGKDYSLAFCPERVLPGNLIHELIHNDRIIGGFDEMSAKKASQIYESFVKGKIYLTDIKTSEIVKLVENTFRDVNLAFSNELKKICLEYGIDVWEVIEMANKHPRVNVLNPGPGVGGHCIPIDPWFLIENIGSDVQLIKSARTVNDSMPFEILKKIDQITGEIESPVITLMGASYKENVGDTRESPTEKIHEELMKKGIDVRVYDPISENYRYKLDDFKEAVRGSDLAVLLVGHDQFGKISFSGLSSYMRNKNILDTRNFFKKEEVEKNGLSYFTA